MAESVFEIRRDERTRKGAWAPGYYSNRCVICGEDFVGDKRALVCADCAYAEARLPRIVRMALAISEWVKERYAAHLLRMIEREARKRKRREEASQDPSDAFVTVVDFGRAEDTCGGRAEQEQGLGSASAGDRTDRGGEDR